MQNTFFGKDSLRNFLNPSMHSPTPLVELPEDLNPYTNHRIKIYAKMMSMLPLMNVKSVPAFMMLQDANDLGLLDGVDTVIEASSGNTVLSLSPLAKAYGIDNTESLVSHEISEGKLKLLRLMGTKAVVSKEPICADPKDPESRIYKARERGKEKGYYNPDQYHNSSNPKGHEEITGPQIWDQLHGKVDVFCCGLGTTGTMIGNSKYLKSRNKNIKSIGVLRAPNNLVPGLRTETLLREISHDWRSAVDGTIEIGTIDSYQKSLDLIRHGLLVGPSSGFALAGLLKWIETQKPEELDALRNQDGKVNCVFICCDSPLPYVDEYFKYLDESNFPAVMNAELLTSNQSTVVKPKSSKLIDEINTEDAFSLLFSLEPMKVQAHLNSNIDIQLRPNTRLLDLRSEKQFNESHIPGAESIPFERLDQDNSLLSQFKGYKVFVVCEYGDKSRFIASLLNEMGINAVNLTEGYLGWSAQNYPRVRNEACLIK